LTPIPNAWGLGCCLTEASQNLEEYRTALDASGLQVDFVRDVTDVTWTPYYDHLRRTLPPPPHGGIQRLQGLVAHYLLARATKP
jgi:hypothetical protein